MIANNGVTPPARGPASSIQRANSVTLGAVRNDPAVRCAARRQALALRIVSVYVASFVFVIGERAAKPRVTFSLAQGTLASWLLRRSFYVDCLASLLCLPPHGHSRRGSRAYVRCSALPSCRLRHRLRHRLTHQHTSGIAAHRGASSATPQAPYPPSSSSSPGSSPVYRSISLRDSARSGAPTVIRPP